MDLYEELVASLDLAGNLRVVSLFLVPDRAKLVYHAERGTGIYKIIYNGDKSQWVQIVDSAGPAAKNMACALLYAVQVGHSKAEVQAIKRAMIALFNDISGR